MKETRMDARYVTVPEDEKGLKTLTILKAGGYSTRILVSGEKPVYGDVAVFSSERSRLGTGAHGDYLRAAAHRLLPDEIAPEWTWSTSLRIAVFATESKRGTSGSFRRAVLATAMQWACWFPGKADDPCPWGNPPRTNGSHHDLFTKWSGIAANEITNQITSSMILESHGVTVTYGDSSLEHWTKPRKLYVMGCAPFNQPHTDIASALHPQKAHSAQQALGWVIADLARFNRIDQVVFVLAGRELMSHEALTKSLHPFFWPSIEEIQGWLGQEFVGETRLFGRTGVRSPDEVGDALELGKHIIEKGIVEPIKTSISDVPISVVRWTDFFSKANLDAGWEIAQTAPAVAIAEKIYEPRVQAREWYKSVEDAMGRDAGIGRTIANLAIYIATGLQLDETPGVMLDVEVDDQYWVEAKPVLEELNCDHHIILSMPQRACQPWTY